MHKSFISGAAVFFVLLACTIGAAYQGADFKASSSNNVPVLTLPDGSELIGELEIAQGYREMLNRWGENPEVFLEQAAFQGKALLQNTISFPGGYTATFKGLHTGYIGGCIKRNLNHVNIVLTKKGKLVCDLSMAAWSESGRIYVGTYSAPKGTCKVLSSPSYNDVKGAIKAFLIGAGVAATVAAVIAAIIAPLVFVALAL